jgi:hypothetical protein
MSSVRIPCASSEAASERELDALATIYRRAVERYEEKQKGGSVTAPDARKESDGSGKTIIPK